VAFLASSCWRGFLFTWLYRHTRGSLLIATAFHASMNTWTTIRPFPSTSPTFLWLLAAMQLLAVGLVLAASGTQWMADDGRHTSRARRWQPARRQCGMRVVGALDRASHFRMAASISEMASLVARASCSRCTSDSWVVPTTCWCLLFDDSAANSSCKCCHTRLPSAD
jgi:hypothetical protein